MTLNSWALARRGVACVATAAMLAGCGTSSSSSSSSVTAVGHTLDIFISEPSGIASNRLQQNVVDAERLAFKQDSGQVHDYGLRLVVVRKPKISDNARAAIQDTSSIAYLGELAPGETEQTAGIANALDLLTVSATDNALELAQSTPAVSGAPSKYFESLSSYGYSFARVVASSQQEAAFDAHAIAATGGPVYIANDGSDYGRALAHAVSQAAPKYKLTVSASAAGAKAIFDAAASPSAAARFLNAAATSNPRAQLFGPSALYSPTFTAALSAAARSRMHVSVPGIPTRQLNGAGRTFRADFAATYRHEPSATAIFGYAAMAALLHVIAGQGENANDRAKVIKGFLSIKDLPSVLGPYSIDAGGNTSLTHFVLLRQGGG